MTYYEEIKTIIGACLEEYTYLQHDRNNKIDIVELKKLMPVLIDYLCKGKNRYYEGFSTRYAEFISRLSTGIYYDWEKKEMIADFLKNNFPECIDREDDTALITFAKLLYKKEGHKCEEDLIEN